MTRLNLIGEYKATILISEQGKRPVSLVGRGTRNIRRDKNLLRDNATQDVIAQYLGRQGRLRNNTFYEVRNQELRGIRTQIIDEEFSYEASKKKGIRVREETFKNGKKFLVARDNKGRFKSKGKV